jgi:hypothetical protein
MKSFLVKCYEMGFFIIAAVMMVPFLLLMATLTVLGALAYAPFHLMNLFKSKP